MEAIINYSLGVIGVWFVSDGLYSILLYLDKPAYHGVKQTWRRDHWIRLCRMVLGMILVGFGGVLIWLP